AAHIHLDTAVLRQAALRDVHPGHNLQTRDDGGLGALRRDGHLLQHAVDAVADLHVFLARLHVNIARAQAEGFEDHLVYVPYNGAVVFVQIAAAGDLREIAIVEIDAVDAGHAEFARAHAA